MSVVTLISRLCFVLPVRARRGRAGLRDLVGSKIGEGRGKFRVGQADESYTSNGDDRAGRAPGAEAHFFVESNKKVKMSGSGLDEKG